jgi:hypothetical protein
VTCSVDLNGRDAKVEIDIDEINKAYKTIQITLQVKESGSTPNHRRLNYPFLEKADHFFHYYKIHMIVGVVLLVAFAYMINAIIDDRREQDYLASLPPADVNILLFGEFYNSDLDALEENILGIFPEWERVNVEMTYASGESRNSYDVARQQASTIKLMDSDVDIFIMDSYNFNIFVNQGLFLSLDQLDESLKNKITNKRFISRKVEEDSKERLYGIDITNSDIFDQVDIISNEAIAMIRIDAKNQENAMKWLEKVAESTDKKKAK